MNPLFPSEDQQQPSAKPKGYVLPPSNKTVVQPLNNATPTGKESADSKPAIELIRRKVDALFAKEPSARQEIAEAQTAATPRSRHQAFMYNLSTSGKPLAQIQTEWHQYYVSLPDAQKHEVWQEFYEANARRPSAYTQFVSAQPPQATPLAQTEPPKPQQTARPALELPTVLPTTTPVTVRASQPPLAPVPTGLRDRRPLAEIKKQILQRIADRNRVQLKAKHHLHSLAFGLGSGLLIIVIFLFGFFNEVIIAPFIQPSRHAGAMPIIVSSDGVAASDTPEVIIPKINVEIPADYTQTSADEEAVQKTLETGILHYPDTASPGQQGNTVYFGHSSNNILNKGKYKFAFVLLHELVPGDVFYLTYNKKVYSYRVYDKKIVEPSAVEVLNAIPGKTATATLITCDPPGTSQNRLVVVGEQISPDPTTNAAPTTAGPATAQHNLPSNGPSMWSRFWHWMF